MAIGHLPIIVCMKHRPILAALAIAAGAWALILGTVAVVQLARFVDVFEVAAVADAPLASSSNALAVPVQQRDSLSVHVSGYAVEAVADALDVGLCRIATAVAAIAEASHTARDWSHCY